MSTLIVRDATLAVNGAPESRGVPGEHMRERVTEAETLERTAEYFRAHGPLPPPEIPDSS